MYSNSYCSCSFEAEILKIGQSSHKMYCNNILNFLESTAILDACTKKVWILIEFTTYVCCLLSYNPNPKGHSARCFFWSDIKQQTDGEGLVLELKRV